MNGYIKSYRKIEENPIVCKDNDFFRVWYYLLHNATHKEREVLFDNEKIILKPGQLITGREVLSKKCNISSSKAQRILKTFESEQQIEQQTTNKNRLISIVNWELYQDYEQQFEQRVNNKWTTNEQQMNTNNNDNNVNNNNNSNNIYAFIEQNFGRLLNSAEIEEISTWEDNEAVRYAISETALKGINTISYVRSIINTYRSKNITTLIAAKQEEENFKKRKQKKYVFNSSTNQNTDDILNNWAHEKERENNDD